MGLSNSQYNEIMREYDQIRARHENERMLRRQMVFAKIPALKQIEDDKASAAINSMRSMLNGGKATKELLDRELQTLEEKRLTLLRNHNIPASYLELGYDCEICKDTGFVDQKKCRCFMQKEINILYRQSGLEEKLSTENFKTFTFNCFDDKPFKGMISPRENMANNVAIVRQFIEQFDKKADNLLFTGSAGTGKTFLTNCIARSLMDRGYSVLYFSAKTLFEVLSDYTFNRNEDSDVEVDIHHIYDCDLLIIDDLGTEFVNNFTIPQLFSCINERAYNKKSVVISTNLSLNDIRDTYSERVSSRIFSSYKILSFYGDDIRVKKAMKKL